VARHTRKTKDSSNRQHLAMILLALLLFNIFIFTFKATKANALQRTTESTLASLNITTDDAYFNSDNRDVFVRNFSKAFQLEPFNTLKDFKAYALSELSTWEKIQLDANVYKEQSKAINELANSDNIVVILTKDDIYVVNANSNEKEGTVYTSTVGKQNWHNLRTNLNNILTEDSVCLYRKMTTFKHLPLDKLVMTSPSGMRLDPISGASVMHTGVDYAMPEGSNIYAVMDGTVKEAGVLHDGCKYVLIQHKDGYTTGYYHCSSIDCKAGDEVLAGDVIAKVGSTGYATGPHLHFEYRKDGKYLVPEEFIDSIPR
jgi:murein DD-endopeptidase MepM/ murein hydrolase activator NlpD